ncbi:hypothetical protein [Kribbella sp. NPDC004536]|uniref:hypothetical protein n=1 Tax=Kribbella sp. NPDC004536 TaxID=3364106 RepID=UPI0036A75F87
MVSPRPGNTRPLVRHAIRRDWLVFATAATALAVCLSITVLLAWIGSSGLLLFGVSVCTVVALFEVAVVVTTRFRP